MLLTHALIDRESRPGHHYYQEQEDCWSLEMRNPYQCPSAIRHLLKPRVCVSLYYLESGAPFHHKNPIIVYNNESVNTRALGILMFFDKMGRR